MNKYYEFFNTIYWYVLSFGVGVLFFNAFYSLKSTYKHIGKISVFGVLCLMLCLFQSCSSKCVKYSYTETKNYKLISLQNQNSAFSSGKMSGSFILGLGGVSGSYNSEEKHKYSFYISDSSGEISRKIVDYQRVIFIDSEKMLVERFADCYTRYDGESFYTEEKEEKRYTYKIYLPISKISNHIQVSH